jgi:hypothetical protein
MINMTIPLQLHNGGKATISTMGSDVLNSIDPEFYRPLDGGYWLSDYKPEEEYPSPWLDFMYRDPEIYIGKAKSSNYVYRVLNEERVFQINLYGDFMRLLSKYPIDKNNFIALDFEKMSEDWDGLYVSVEGYKNCYEADLSILNEYFPDRNIIPPTLKSWDIPSLLVFNTEILELVMEFENKFYVEPE